MKNKIRVSLVTKISLLFFSLTLLNVLFFWISSGSNQLRLIAEKATAEAQSQVTEIKKNIERINGSILAGTNTAQYAISINNALEMAARDKQNKSGTWPDFQLVSAGGRVLISWPKKNITESVLKPETLKAAIRAIQLREFSNTQFYGEPDVLHYSVNAFIPVFNAADSEVVLVTKLSVMKIRDELDLLLRSALGIVVLLTVLQILVGVVIYRKLLRPILAVTRASVELGGGKHVEIERYAKNNDELGILVRTFNQMSVNIRDQKTELEKNYKDLKKKSDMMNFELNIAQKIQAAILPKDFKPGGMLVEAEYNPLYGVSGDYFDWFQFRDGSTGFIICDASGHGVPAALLTIMAKSYFSSFAESYEDPAALLRSANADIARALDGGGHYLTAFYARIYPDGTLKYANATHPLPFVFDETTGNVTSLEAPGFYIGLLQDLPMDFETRELKLTAKQKLVFYTDGITEAINEAGDMFGDDRLKAIVAECGALPPAELKQTILKDLQTFCGTTALRDDVTLVVIEVGEVLSGAHRGQNLKEAIESYRSFDFTKAIDIFNTLRADSPELMTGAALSYFADTYFKLKQFSKALPLFKEYLERYGERDVVLMKIGTCLMKERQFDTALMYFQRATDLDKNFAEAYAGVAACLMRLGRTEEALNSVQTALALKPDAPRFQKLRDKIAAAANGDKELALA